MPYTDYSEAMGQEMTITAERVRELLELGAANKLRWRVASGKMKPGSEARRNHRQIELDGRSYSKKMIAQLITMPDGTPYSAVPPTKGTKPKHNNSKYGPVKPWETAGLSYQIWRYRLRKGTLAIAADAPQPPRLNTFSREYVTHALKSLGVSDRIITAHFKEHEHGRT